MTLLIMSPPSLFLSRRPRGLDRCGYVYMFSKLTTDSGSASDSIPLASLDGGSNIMRRKYGKLGSTLRSVITAHPKLVSAGEGSATPRLVVRGQDTFHKFMKTAP